LVDKKRWRQKGERFNVFVAEADESEVTRSRLDARRDLKAER
jgi:hypothetical protein